MDNREKIYEHGGELRNVQDLFEITANHAHYQFFSNLPSFISCIKYVSMKRVLFHFKQIKDSH